jgi:ABC-type Fe3+/spermidine/putrescine transport system ATPase subunit
MPAVLVENVSRHFGEVVAVDRVNLSVEHGEFVTLLGPSGSSAVRALALLPAIDSNLHRSRRSRFVA